MKNVSVLCFLLGALLTATTVGAAEVYLSEKGDDAADGSTPAKAIRSIGRLNEMTFRPGDRVLFKRGELFRGSVQGRSGVTYGAYGEGRALPTICGSRRDYADPALWVPTDVTNVWRCTEKLHNVGIVLFDGEPKSIPDGAVVADMRLPARKERYDKPMTLDADLTFKNLFHEDRIELRSDFGNPGRRFRHIEIGEHGHCIWINADDLVVENLHLTLSGSLGVGGSDYRRNITVRDCRLDWIGGSIIMGWKWGTVRFGNAIEIWGGCNGFSVLNNRIANVYDTGVTIQCNDRADFVCKIENVLFASNVIDNCFWALEYYNRNNAPGSYTRNVRFVGNLCRNTGRGWGCKGRERFAPAVSIGETPEGSSGFVVEGNRFIGSTGPLVLIREPVAKGAVAFRGNVYAQTPGGVLLSRQPQVKTFATTAEKRVTHDIPFDGTAPKVVCRELGDATARVLTLPADSPTFSVDFSRCTGKVRALNGLNNAPPISGTQAGGVGDRLVKPLKVPFFRFHDDVLQNPGYALVDVSQIFPLFHADADDSRNYNFGPTDDYLRFCVESGARIEFRLGESIEHAQKNYRAVPPPDPVKWAEVCAHVVRHYTAGWANGYKWNIRHWSVWEEPTNQELFRGRNAYVEKYLPLYEATARRLKREFPDILVGGPNCQGVGRDFELFVDYCRETKTPLDFVCWTAYGRDPEQFARAAEVARAYLDCRGFGATRIGISEWHYGPVSWKGHGCVTAARHSAEFLRDLNGDDSVAFTAATLIRMQDTPIDAMFYYAMVGDAWGVLDVRKQPKCGYYALLAFADFPAMRRVRAETAPNAGWHVLAAKDESGRGLVLVAALKNKGWPKLSLNKGVEPLSVRVIDSVRSFEETSDWTFDRRSGRLAIERRYGESGVWLVEVKVSEPGARPTL